MGKFKEFADRMAQRGRDEQRRQAFQDALAKAQASPKPGASPLDTQGSMVGLADARRQAWFMVAGKPHVRIAWGLEAGSLERPGLCTGCGARPGELHLPGCAQEECPSCGSKAMGCDCEFGS